MTTAFTDLTLHPELVQAVTELGYTEPTPIQVGVIPLMIEGHDIIGQAQTGTGKTAAFSLPVLQNITPNGRFPQSLILAPTRELAMQVAQAMYKYGQHAGVQVLAIYGGQPYHKQIKRLKRGVDVVVGTPGRVLDLINQKALKLHDVKTFVLDEADEMLSMGFIEDIETVIEALPDEHQTALFSATLPKAIRRLADRYMKDPKSVTIERKQLTVEAIEQRHYMVNQRDKLAALMRLFEVEPITTALIFARTRVGTAQLANELTVRGFPAEALNGDLSQEAREHVMRRFRTNQIKVLVATDVAARGLDVDDISHVFNYDLPLDPEIYVHRIGRTGRAGKTGIAISLVTPQERGRLRRIERLARAKLAESTLPTIQEIKTFREEQVLENMMVWLRRGRCVREKEMIMRFVDEGHDPLMLAAAALKLARAEEKQRPIAKISEVSANSRDNSRGRGRDRSGGRSRNQRDRRGNNGSSNGHRKGYSNGQRNGSSNGKGKERRSGKRSHEEGMVRLSLDVGKSHGIRPNDIVGSIAYHSNIPGRVIGAIQIQDKQTFVDIPQEHISQVLDQPAYPIRQHPVTITRVG